MSECPCGTETLSILNSLASDDIPFTNYYEKGERYEYCRDCGFCWGVKE